MWWQQLLNYISFKNISSKSRGKLFKLSLNPVGTVIFVCVMFVTIKVGHITQLKFLETALAAKPEKKESKMKKTASKDSKKGKDMADKSKKSGSKLQEKLENKTKVMKNILGGAIITDGKGKVDYTKFDPAKITPEELDLLYKLNKRRQEIIAKTKKIDEKKHAMGALHKTLDEKIAILKRLKQDINSALKNSKKKESKNIDKLVVMYEAMKPKSAAAIFNGLNINLVFLIMEKMKKDKASIILANMKPEKARMITQKLAIERNVNKNLQKYRDSLGE